MLFDLAHVDAPFSAAGHLTLGPDGRDHLAIIVKSLYHVAADGSLQARTASIRRLIQPHDVPRSSVRYSSDLAPHKPGSEVLLVGHARRPQAFANARFIDVGLTVHGDKPLLSKSIRVFGPRVWQQGAHGVIPSEPGLAEDTPLRWEHAYGGRCADSGSTLSQNPLGSGHSNKHSALLGQPVFAMESAQVGERHAAGFGPIHPHWEPRRSRRGTMNADWATTHAPLPPKDRAERYHCVAPDDQWLAEPLSGTETFSITGTEREGMWLFTLPGVLPEIVLERAGRSEVVRPHLDTVSLDADQRTVELSFRTLTHAAPKWQEDPISVRRRYVASTRHPTASLAPQPG